MLLKSLLGEMSESGRLKMKAAILLDCEEGVFSGILKKSEGSGDAYSNCGFNNFQHPEMS